MEDEFLAYDLGYRQGVFDKCNGHSQQVVDEGDGSIWGDGYLDGWNANENQFPEVVPTGSTFDTDQNNTPMRFYKLWCEFDYGQEGFIFDNEPAARNWLEARIRENDEPPEENAEFYFDEGLAGVDIVELIV